MPFVEPYKKTRDMVRFLKKALTGEKVDEEFDTFTVKGFRLDMRVPEPPPILVAALRPGMLRMAGREADGAIINWLSPDDVKKVAPEVGAGKEIVARIFVVPSEDADIGARRGQVRGGGLSERRGVREVPRVARTRRRPRRRCGSTGRKATARPPPHLFPDHVVDELIVHGSPDECREKIARYVENGVTTPVLAVLPFGIDPLTAARALAPK